MTERYVVQRATTLEVLTYDVPGDIRRGPITRQLSAVGSLTLTVPGSVVQQLASDGLPLFLEWGTLVTVLDDDQILYRGIVEDMTFGSPDWEIEVPSISRYPHDTPWDGEVFYGAKVDPADLVRKMWAYVQSFTSPASNLGVTVVGSTPVRVGSYSTQNKADTLAAYNAAVKAYDAENATLKQLRDAAKDARKAYSSLVAARTSASRALTAAKKTKDPAQIAAAQAVYDRAVADGQAQQRVIDVRQAAVDDQAKIVAARKSVKDSTYKAKVTASKAAKEDGGAYELLWWDAPDCGQRIDELATSTPFDWVEEHYWDGDVPATRIRILHPRAGRRLSRDSDPTFVQGVNISQPVVPEVHGDDFANVVLGVGAGEGAGSVRRSIAKDNGRLRRVRSFEDKDEKTAQGMDAKLRIELNALLVDVEVQQITVLDHENSPRGSYDLGDDIYVQATVPHYGDLELWHRIVGITDNNDGTTELELKRSETFTYGKGVDE